MSEHPLRAKQRGPKAHYMALLDKGVDPNIASEMAGYHPIEEFEKQLGLWIKALCIFAVCYFLLGIALGYDRANAALTGAEESERVLVACLNGSPIHAGDEWYQCNRLDVPRGELNETN